MTSPRKRTSPTSAKTKSSTRTPQRRKANSSTNDNSLIDATGDALLYTSIDLSHTDAFKRVLPDNKPLFDGGNSGGGGASESFGDGVGESSPLKLGIGGFTFPQLAMPEISLPEISLPELSLPEISLPEIDLGDVDLGGIFDS